jgi:hypothetical protein
MADVGDYPGDQTFPGKRGLVTREQWARLFLSRIRAPITHKNLVAMVAWMAAEGGPQTRQATWNPLNTTMPWTGSTIFNAVGVRNYPSLNDGLEASIKTIKLPGVGYEAIIRRLRKSANPGRTLDAVETSSWGTGGLAARIVGDVKDGFEAYASAPIGQG